MSDQKCIKTNVAETSFKKNVSGLKQRKIVSYNKCIQHFICIQHTNY